MMTWARERLTVTQIKMHPFFYGADWTSLRNIEPPFVPHLKSITDTTYFDENELGSVANALEKGEAIGAEKDLAFLGQVMLFIFLVMLLMVLLASHSSASLVALGHKCRAIGIHSEMWYISTPVGRSCLHLHTYTCRNNITEHWNGLDIS